MKIWGVIDCCVAIGCLWLSGEMPRKWMTAVLFACAVAMFGLGSVLILNSFA